MPVAGTRRTAGSFGDRLFEWLCLGAGVLVLVTLGGIIITLFIGGLPAFGHFGLGFLFSTNWDPVEGREEFGAFISIFGTVVSSL
jgi:phosphate transport system permease protein